MRTFHPRRAALGPARADALERLWPVLGVSVHDDSAPPPLRDGLLDRVALFGRSAPLVLEIGAGMGEAVLAAAAADPGRDFLAAEVHVPAVATLLLEVERAGLANVRVVHGDALDLVRRWLPEGSLDAVHVFFPDPWPKARHRGRRLVSPERVALLRSRLVVGGVLHCATDWLPYAEQMLEVLRADPGLDVEGDDFVPRPAHRPVTRFERRGLALGHEVRDVVARRRA